MDNNQVKTDKNVTGDAVDNKLDPGVLSDEISSSGNLSTNLLKFMFEASQKKKVLLVGFIVIGVLIILSLVILLPKLISTKTYTNQTMQQISGNAQEIDLKVDNTPLEGAFVEGYPDFDSLTITSFSGIQDIRDIYTHNDNLIVAGYSGVYEIDDKNNSVVRRLVPGVLPCTNWTTKIDNFLYILCYSSSAEYYGVFKLDLETGDIVKSYKNYRYQTDGRDSRDFTFTNSSIASHGNTLWLGGIEGVVSIDTLTDKIYLYKPEDIGYDPSTQYFIHSNHENVWVTTDDGVSIQASVYNPKTDSWSFISENNIPKALDTLTTEFKWPQQIPTFYALSNQRFDKYYLSHTQRIWKLSRGDKSPSLFYEYNIDNFTARSLYISEDGKTLVLLGPDEKNIPEDIYLKIFLLNTENKTLTDISPSEQVYNSSSDEKKRKYSDIVFGDFTSFKEDQGIISIIKSDSRVGHGEENGIIGEINLVNKRFSLK